jgi:hypothetical protein
VLDTSIWVAAAHDHHAQAMLNIKHDDVANDQAKPVPLKSRPETRSSPPSSCGSSCASTSSSKPPQKHSRSPPLEAQCLLLSSEGDVEDNDAPVHDCNYTHDAIDLPAADHHTGVLDANDASCGMIKYANQSEGMSVRGHLMGYVVGAVQRAMWNQKVLLQRISRVEEEQLECAFIQFGEDEYVWWEMVEVEIKDGKSFKNRGAAET